MYWDALTATGVCVSILLTLAAFYLALRERPSAPRKPGGSVRPVLPAGAA